MSSDQMLPLLNVFAEARQWGRGGEVVIRCGAETGRVFFVGGKIAWATASTHQRTLIHCIVEHSALTKEKLQEVFEACKQSGQNFAEALVEQGLLAEGMLRHLLLRHLAECLFEILCWPSAESMFVPEERSYKGSLILELDEVLQTVIDIDTQGRLAVGGATAQEILRRATGDGEGQERAPQEGAAASPYGPTHEVAPLAAATPAGATQPSAAESSAQRAAGGNVVPAETTAASRRRLHRGHIVALWVGGGVVVAALAGVVVGRLVAPSSPRPAITSASAAGARTGQVRITSTPTGAHVFLDGIASGVTPAQVDQIEPRKKYALRVTLEGWQPWETRFVLTTTSHPMEFEALLRKLPTKSGKAVSARRDPRLAKADPQSSSTGKPRRPEPEALQVVLPEAKGTGRASILVTSRPPRAEIYLDGLRTGKRTPATLRAAGLLHVVQLTRKGYAPSQKTVKATKNRVTKVEIVLEKGAHREAGAGLVVLDSVPKGAVVLVSGKRQKQATPITLALSKPSKLDVMLKGYKPWTRTVTPVSGVKLAFTVRLQKRRR